MDALTAGPTQLVFQIPTGVRALPFTLETLLSWTALEPSLAPSALRPNPLPEEIATALIAAPATTQTAIEIPAGVFLSPDSTAGWAHALAPVVRNGRVELWHTRLAAAAQNGVDETLAPLSMRAIWSPDFVALSQPASPDPLPETYPGVADRCGDRCADDCRRHDTYRRRAPGVGRVALCRPRQ